MAQHDILYIAELIVSEKLQRLYPENTLPPLLKVGITTGSIANRNNQLLSTKSPFMTRIVKAWNVKDAKKIESLLHSLMDNSRVEGEYFDDGKASLIDAVSDFIESMVHDASEIDVASSYDARVIKSLATTDEKKVKQLETDLIPALKESDISYRLSKSSRSLYLDDIPGTYNKVYVTRKGYTFRVRNITISEDSLADATQDYFVNIYQAAGDAVDNCSITFSELTPNDVVAAKQLISQLVC